MALRPKGAIAALAIGQPSLAAARAWLALVLADLAGWVWLARSHASILSPGSCGSSLGWVSSGWSGAEAALLLNPPARLVMLWLVMVWAMMTPLLAEPITHLWTCGSARLRPPFIALFVASYAAVWLVAGVLLMGGRSRPQGSGRRGGASHARSGSGDRLALAGLAPQAVLPQRLSSASPPAAVGLRRRAGLPSLRRGYRGVVRRRLLGLDVGAAGCRSDALRADGGRRNSPVPRTTGANTAGARSLDSVLAVSQRRRGCARAMPPRVGTRRPCRPRRQD